MEQPSSDRREVCLRDNTTHAPSATPIGVDGSGTCGLGLGILKGDGEECRKEIH